MRTLYKGLTGDDVRAWEHFLVGIDPTSQLVVDGNFDDATKVATQAFQRKVGLGDDGVVGPKTLGRAMLLGFDPLVDDRTNQEDTAAWPPVPAEGPLSTAVRGNIFGNFAYRAAGNPANPEAIIITDNWASTNIMSVNVPQLKGVPGAPANCNVPFHKLAAKQLQDTFAAWEAAGLRDRVLGWAGSWAPRFIRGSRSVLSNHAWATAFDINVPWNMLGSQPALKGQKGSVRELVQIAYDHGFYWGGWFQGRPDGMHFEVRKILP